jgi:hypothetical protein
LDDHPSKAFPDPGVLDIVEERIKSLLGDNDAVWVEGYGKALYGWTAGRTSFVDIGKAVEYLKDVTAPTGKLADELNNMVTLGVIDKMVLSQLVTVLKNVADVPSVVTSKYVKTGEPYRSLRTYPAKM